MRVVTSLLLLMSLGCANHVTQSAERHTPPGLREEAKPGMTYDQVKAVWGASMYDITSTETATSYSVTAYFQNEGGDQRKGDECPSGRWAVKFEAKGGKKSGNVDLTTDLVAATVSRF